MAKLKYPGHPKGADGLLCKCSECRAYQAERVRVGRRDRAKLAWGVRVDTGWIDATEARRTLRAARKNGASGREMMRVTGLGEVTVYQILIGNRKKVMRHTHNLIQDAYGDGTRRILSPGQRLPIREHKWKLRCIMAQGWSVPRLRILLQEHGRDYPRMNRTLLREDYQYWTWATVQEIDWLVEHIGDRHGPSPITKSRMLKKGFFPLIHYTEEGRLIRTSLTKEQKAAVQ